MEWSERYQSEEYTVGFTDQMEGSCLPQRPASPPTSDSCAPPNDFRFSDIKAGCESVEVAAPLW